MLFLYKKSISNLGYGQRLLQVLSIPNRKEFKETEVSRLLLNHGH